MQNIKILAFFCDCTAPGRNSEDWFSRVAAHLVFNCTGNPDNWYGHEDCTDIYPSYDKGDLNDADCSTQQLYLCQKIGICHIGVFVR